MRRMGGCIVVIVMELKLTLIGKCINCMSKLYPIVGLSTQNALRHLFVPDNGIL